MVVSAVKNRGFQKDAPIVCQLWVITMIKCILLIPSVFFLVLSSSYSIAYSVEGPKLIVSSAFLEKDINKNYQFDAPITTIPLKRDNNWIQAVWDKGHGGIIHMKFTGTVDEPLKTILWSKDQRSLFVGSNTVRDGNFWIVNTYTNAKDVLAFVHVENAENSSRYGGPGKSRIGLAWSANGGDSFVFLGYVISPYNDSMPFNIQGAPYIIKDGYFYVYFHDTSGLTIARAPFEEVIFAAKSGKVSPWYKYNGREDFTSNALGGPSKRIGVDGISHADAACSSYNNKCYLVLTRMNWKNQDTWVRLFESGDGINWTYKTTIAQEKAGDVKHGYQYATIVNIDGGDNSAVGNRFYIYCNKDHQDSSHSILRWTVELDTSTR